MYFFPMHVINDGVLEIARRVQQMLLEEFILTEAFKKGINQSNSDSEAV